MKAIISEIRQGVIEGFKQINAHLDIEANQIQVNEVRPEFEGDFAVVLFPFLKPLRMGPNELGEQLGQFLVSYYDWVEGFSIVKGFLNLHLSDARFLSFLEAHYQQMDFGKGAANQHRVMIEYSSPNTNKPLHFGHLRNIFLGWSMSEIMAFGGYKVIKANLVNDRGIHICKSMIAWQKYGNGATPESTGIKGDHLVGDYYVKFNEVYKEEISTLMGQGLSEEEAGKQAPIFLEAQEMLRQWEEGDPEVKALWEKMNQWVFKGFDTTYKALGIDFDKTYYESQTYLLGKDMVEEGLAKGILYQKDNQSVWIDLRADGLDEKLLLRSDGTSVYMTQDLGTARLKYSDYNIDESIYVIGDEQNYHMEVLKLILTKMGEPCADGIFHLSYGMVELPTGKMKSREGTVVDADDMIEEMVHLAAEQSQESGKTEGFSEEELSELYKEIGLGALKFYLLRVDPKKRMIFDPKESIDLQGYTATFVQYAHARINSILRKIPFPHSTTIEGVEPLAPLEKELLIRLEDFPSIIRQAVREYNPSVLCNYSFKLAQTFNSFFDKHSIIRAENEGKKLLRLKIAQMTGLTLKRCLNLLGAKAPERM